MLEVDDLSKTYAPPGRLLRLIMRGASRTSVEALRGIEFVARPGEIVGIIGPNGAGKSTLIRLIANLLTPTTGAVRINGAVIADSASTHHDIGLLLSDERSLYWRLTGRQNLEFFGAMAGLDTKESRRRADRALELAGLAHRDRRVFGYSAGMRVELGLARAMLNDPSLLILDEPSRSLDPLASEHLLRRLRAQADAGCTVLLSSHRLDEVEAICDRVLVILDGHQRYWGAVDALTTPSTGAATALRSLLIASDAAERPLDHDGHGSSR